MNTNNTQPYLIPLAIVVAGGLIAAGVFFGGTKDLADNQPAAEIASTFAEIAIAPITSSDRVLGNASADVLMVEYSDTECPFCKQFHTTLHKVVENFGKDGKVAWVYRHFPIPQLHPKAPKEAEAIECAAEQGGTDAFWKYTDQVYTRTPSNNKLEESELPKIANAIGIDVPKFNECLSSGRMAARVEEQAADARKSGGNGTPYTVFVNKNEVSEEVIDFVESANATFGTPPGQELLHVSDDKMRVSVSGAMQYEFLVDLLAVLQK